MKTGRTGLRAAAGASGVTFCSVLIYFKVLQASNFDRTELIDENVTGVRLNLSFDHQGKCCGFFEDRSEEGGNGRDEKKREEREKEKRNIQVV